MDEEIIITRRDILKLIDLIKLQTRTSERLKHDQDNDSIQILQRAIMSIQKDINSLVPLI
jgi:hypothetical protein